ncbi:MAG: class I SAM-dependent methyltransferase, partial [Actinomycetota bacterium]
MVHEAAATGFSRDPDRYHRGRPSYHPEVSKRVAERYGKGIMVELGAGTGIFTRQLVDEGLEVIALEPVISMRTTLSEAVPEADVRVGSAEKIPMADGSVDTVVVAQAFHWFDAEQALDEIDRVLVPGGHLVTVWNVRDDGEPWMAAYNTIVERHAGNTPRYRSMMWRKAIHDDPRFSP